MKEKNIEDFYPIILTTRTNVRCIGSNYIDNRYTEGEMSIDEFLVKL